MSGDYLAQRQPTLLWNSARGVWEKPGMASLLCEHWELFSETWPTSGMTQNGQVFELPMQVRHTTDLESSLLRSPTASQGEGGALGEEEARKRGNTVGIRDQAMDLALANGHKVSRAELMPTPLTSDGAVNGSAGAMARKSPQVSAIVHGFLPTPAVSDNRGAARSEVEAGDPKHRLKVAVELLPTTRTSMKNGATQKEIDAGNPKFRIEAVTNWGKFEPAIKRWEQVIGRKAPAPTKPDGKDGSHRLSSAFTEWMMGVPEGWITDCGLSRNDELKACGNGVVPQQA